MKFDWSEYLNKTLYVIMTENYGMQYDTKNDKPLYEIVYKIGKLVGAYDEGILLEDVRETNKESHVVKIFIPHYSIKCVEIFNV